MPMNVLIVGGGPAALEAALSLHRLAGDRVATTVLAPESDYTYRPLSVLAPFAAGGAMTYSLERIAADAGFTHVRDRLSRVDTVGHTATTVTGTSVPYDVLLIASGARPVQPPAGAIAFTGSLADQERLHGIVQDVEGGYLHSLAFVVPSGNTWPLPLYELALMLAERAFTMCAKLDLHVVTPEVSPLAVFGADASQEVQGLLETAGITVHCSASPEVLGQGRLLLAPGAVVREFDRVITLPQLEGPAIPGLPADPAGFLVTDDHARVQGAADVYAAGDVTSFAIKQGGIACQQADAAAEDIAARAGATVDPAPFTPVLRGLLLTERWARFLRRDVDTKPDASATGTAHWWPSTKIAGRELAGYLQRLDEEAGRHVVLPNDVGDVGTDGAEVLSLH